MKQLLTSSCFVFFGGASSGFNSFNTRQTDLRYTTDNEECPLKRDHFKRKVVFQPSFLRRTVSFWGVSSNRATIGGDLQHWFWMFSSTSEFIFFK